MQDWRETAAIGVIVLSFFFLAEVWGQTDPGLYTMVKQGLAVTILFLVIRQMASWRVVFSADHSTIQQMGYPVPVANTQCSYAPVAGAIGHCEKQWDIMWPQDMSTKQRKGCSAMNRKGFTLIELLIVIAILGILVALILPRFADVQENANTKVCVANLRGLASAMATYETMNNYPTCPWGTAPYDDPEYMVTDLNLMAQEPYCPYAAEAKTSYILVANAGSSPDHATCPEVGAHADHIWP